MSEETFNLDRETQIEANVDAFSRQWKIHSNRGTGLCYVRPNPDREDAVIPKEMGGLWTKPSLLTPKIKDYITKTWDEADLANKKAERKRLAALEASKQEKAKNDTRSTKK